MVVKDEGCQAIADKNGIRLSEFLTWNPNVGGSSCPGMWADVYVCVNVIGRTPGKPSTIKTSVTPAPTGCAASHPEPTQPGSVCDCKQWYLPADGEFCEDIERKFGLSWIEWLSWNTKVGADCKGLCKDTYVCVNA